MKLPDLPRLDDSAVLEYHGHPDAIAAAASHAKLRYLNVDLGHVYEPSDDASSPLSAEADYGWPVEQPVEQPELAQTQGR